jgi:hypothetical protein
MLLNGQFFLWHILQSFSSKYVYVEAASTAVAPSISTLSRIYVQYNVLYMLSHPQFIKINSDNSFLTRQDQRLHRVVGPGGGGMMAMGNSE